MSTFDAVLALTLVGLSFFTVVTWSSRNQELAALVLSYEYLNVGARTVQIASSVGVIEQLREDILLGRDSRKALDTVVGMCPSQYLCEVILTRLADRLEISRSGEPLSSPFSVFVTSLLAGGQPYLLEMRTGA